MMSLTVRDQLKLLHDLLDEHLVERNGEVAEYQQIKRLIRSMMTNQTVTDEQLNHLLPEIYNYGRRGENARNSSEHVTANQENIENWKNAITNVYLE